MGRLKPSVTVRNVCKRGGKGGRLTVVESGKKIGGAVVKRVGELEGVVLVFRSGGVYGRVGKVEESRGEIMVPAGC